jgi:mono/diheme cytochrome c family protein
MRRVLFLAALALLLNAARATAEVDFVKDVKPILEQSCITCHGPEKVKGGLRLDTKEGLLKGSKRDKVVKAGNADESRLYEVITLPKNDPAHMPSEAESLPKAQIDRLRDWINEGLKWPDGLVLKAAEGTSTGGTTTVTVPTDPGLPISDAEKAAVGKLQQSGVLAMRLAQNTNWLRVDFSLGKKDVKDEDLVLLKDVPNLVELNLGNTTLTDAGMVHLKGLVNLTRLQLHNTKVTDAGLKNLEGLQKLTSLNLYGTEVTDKGLESLKGIKKLRNLYVWQTKVTEEGAKKLAEAIPGVYVNRGPETAAVPPKPSPYTEKPE